MSRGLGLQPPRVGQNDFFRAIWQFFGPKNWQIAPDFSGKLDSAPLKKSARTPMAQADSKDKYSNELHDSLLRKEGNKFWKCWNAKFEKKSCTPNKVDGNLDPDLIVDSFVRHFKSICTDTKTGASLELVE